MNNQYIISQLSNSNQLRYALAKGTKVEWISYNFATVFRSREQAEKVAKKHGGQVEVFYGKMVAGSKGTVAPKQSPINKAAPYRTI
jgi:hypothetical protein